MGRTETVYGSVAEVRPGAPLTGVEALFGGRRYTIISYGDDLQDPLVDGLERAVIERTEENDGSRFAQTRVTYKITKILQDAGT